MSVTVCGENLSIEDVCKVAYEGESVDFPEKKRVLGNSGKIQEIPY